MLLYDAVGRLANGGAERAIDPRIKQLEDQIASLGGDGTWLFFCFLWLPQGCCDSHFEGLGLEKCYGEKADGLEKCHDAHP